MKSMINGVGTGPHPISSRQAIRGGNVSWRQKRKRRAWSGEQWLRDVHWTAVTSYVAHLQVPNEG